MKKLKLSKGLLSFLKKKGFKYIKDGKLFVPDENNFKETFDICHEFYLKTQEMSDDEYNKLLNRDEEIRIDDWIEKVLFPDEYRKKKRREYQREWRLKKKKEEEEKNKSFITKYILEPLNAIGIALVLGPIFLMYCIYEKCRDLLGHDI